MGNITIVIGSWGSYNECNERALGSKWLDLGYKMLSILIIIINVLLTIDNNCIYNLGILSHWYCANLSYGFPEEFLQNIAIFRNDIVRKEK